MGRVGLVVKWDSQIISECFGSFVQLFIPTEPICCTLCICSTPKLCCISPHFDDMRAKVGPVGRGNLSIWEKNDIYSKTIRATILGVIGKWSTLKRLSYSLLALWVYYSIHGRSGSCAPPCCPQPLATFMHGSERPKHATWRSNLEILFFITAPRSLSWWRFQGVSVFQVSPGKIKYFCMF